MQDIFKHYKRVNVSEIREVTLMDIVEFENHSFISVTPKVRVSISEEDLKSGSPKLGDMIARNPENHLDQWLIAAKYFKENFELV